MSDPNAVWIAEQLTMHRLQQKDLAAALGTDPSAVTRLLKGQRRLKPAEVPLIMRFFSQFTDGNAPPQRLARAMSMREVDMDDLATRTGIAPSRLLQIKYGQAVPASERERAELAAAFGQSVDYLFAETPSTGSDLKALREGWRSAASQRSSPGPALGPPTGRAPVYRPLPWAGNGWYHAQFELAERRDPPPSLRDVAGAFGIYVDSAVHSPLLLPGEVFWVHPGRPALEGSRVLARTGDGLVAPGLFEYVQGERLLRSGRMHERLDAAVRLEAIVCIDTR